MLCMRVASDGPWGTTGLCAAPSAPDSDPVVDVAKDPPGTARGGEAAAASLSSC
jgi:hypothetical protein